MRTLSPLDHFLQIANEALQTLSGLHPDATRENPAQPVINTPLKDQDLKVSQGLMRINHTGEVCAQALYQGQALTARDPNVKISMQACAKEEQDHLKWCQERLDDLNTHTSFLNPLWWMGSFTIGVAAGLAGDRWSLGFLAQTEHQVCAHLNKHLNKLPGSDHQSRAIVAQMHWDENQHALHAESQGAAVLPKPIQAMMQFSSKIMTTLTYYV